MSISLSIRQKIFIVIALLLLPLGAHAVYHYREMVGHDLRNARLQNGEASRVVAMKIDGMIGQTFTLLSALARHPAVMERDAAACDTLFSGLLPSQPHMLNLFLVGTDGRTYGSAARFAEGRKLRHADAPWFREGLKGPFVGGLHDPRPADQPAIMIALPVKGTGGETIGMLAAPVLLGRLAEELNALRTAYGDMALTVTDNRNAALVGPDGPGGDLPRPRLRGVPEGIVLRDDDGVLRLHSITRTSSVDWTVVTSVPMDAVIGGARSLGRRYLLIFACFGALGLGLSVYLARGISGNVSRIGDAMSIMERGSAPARIQPLGNDELSDLALRFNTMAAARETAERRVRASEAFLASVLDGIGAGVVVVDDQYRIVNANKGYCGMVGVDCEEIIGKQCHETSHGKADRCFIGDAEHKCPVQRCFETGRPQQTIHEHCSEGARSLIVEAIAYPLRADDGKVVRVIETLTDITEQKEMETQLHQAQKMEAVGHLAGGIAHDFNNILTVILGYCDLLTRQGTMDPQSRSHVAQISSAVRRAADLVQGLLTFSRKKAIAPRPVILDEIARSSVDMLKRLIRADIDLKMDLSASGDVVQADPVQIEQVLMNLVTNARDAMPQGGQLMVRTASVELDEDQARHHAQLSAGCYVLLEVIDTGRGMDGETRERIFEPFFTTKEVGKGTGLGLSVVYGIVKQHKGDIQVHSEPGKGTVFRIYLPAVASAGPFERPTRQAAVAGGSETILFAEDEPTVREIGRTVLEDAGYIVVEAQDGEEAVQRFREEPDRYDLVIFDVIMPKRSGRDAADEIQRIRPGIRVLFISGYTADIMDRHEVPAADGQFLAKPFTPQDLQARVRELLDQ